MYLFCHICTSGNIFIPVFSQYIMVNKISQVIFAIIISTIFIPQNKTAPPTLIR